MPQMCRLQVGSWAEQYSGLLARWQAHTGMQLLQNLTAGGSFHIPERLAYDRCS